jgi:hypothetical protein
MIMAIVTLYQMLQHYGIMPLLKYVPLCPHSNLHNFLAECHISIKDEPSKETPS